MITYITFGLAVLGAVLGVINTWLALDKTRVKLKVVPVRAYPYGGAPQQVAFSVEITNLSDFAVTVCEVGLFYHNTDRRSVIIQPILADNGPWPRRLEPRSAVTVYSEMPQLVVKGNRLRCAFVKTQCGVVKEGTSGAMKQLAASA